MDNAAMRTVPLLALLAAACTQTRYEPTAEQEERIRRIMEEEIAQANGRLQLSDDQRPRFRSVVLESTDERRAVLLKQVGQPRTTRNMRFMRFKRMQGEA